MATAATVLPNLVGGDWMSAGSDVIEVRDPADVDRVLAMVPAMSASDVTAVYDSSAAGARVWGATGPLERGPVLSRAAVLLRERGETIATDLVAEMGKTLAEARVETAMVALHLARALHDAGLPAGVLGTVTGRGSEIGKALLADPRLAAVSFTDSNAVGMELRHTLADRHVRLQTEMGGKNATAVLADADLDLAAQTIAAAAFGQAGQRCTATRSTTPATACRPRSSPEASSTRPASRPTSILGRCR
jgi:acyl-CoA reductase-like NAD-dependent aldehyde dehydrogenase